MSDGVPIFCGSYRSDRQGIRLANYLVDAFAVRGASPELLPGGVVLAPGGNRQLLRGPICRGENGAALARAFPCFADDLAWWTEAARAQRARSRPPD